MSKKKIFLYWYRHKEGNGNFGDELSPYIILKLTGKDIKFVNIVLLHYKCKKFLKTITYHLFKKNMKISSYLENLYYYFIKRPKVLVAIGSILERVNYKNCIVWGSGIMASNSYFAKVDFRAVRGKRTQERLRELGYPETDAIGDPAILVPLIYQPKVAKKHEVGIIPHYYHFEKLKHLNSENILVINLLDNVEAIIEQILSCKITFSTSLHGIIVSHAYEVPSVWITDRNIPLGGDNIKFSDYFSSVDIQSYDPIDSKELNSLLLKKEQLSLRFSQIELLPKKEKIQELQNQLLREFPFKVIDKYTNKKTQPQL